MGKITWIKNDKIKTMGELAYICFGKEEAYSSRVERLLDMECIIPEDVELLHLKKVYFAGTTVFKCLNENTIVILEECGLGLRTEFQQGNIVIERPKIKNHRGCSTTTKFENVESVELALSDEVLSTSDEWYMLNGVKTLSVTGEAKNTTINMMNRDDERIESVRINNAHNLSLEGLKAQKIEIKNSKIKLKNTLDAESLHIIKSTVTGPFSFELLGKTEIKDSEIKCHNFMIADDAFTPKNKELVFSSEKEESGNLAVARLKLISDLKAISDKVSTACAVQEDDKKNQLEKRYEKEIQEHEKALAIAQSHQEYYANLIVERQAAISMINQELDSKMENIKTGLAHQKIKTIALPKSNKR